MSPRFSASSTICLAGRSLTDWPGFMNSALPRMVQPVASDARLSLISGVPPIASTTPSRMGMGMLVRLVWRANLMEACRAYKVGGDGSLRSDFVVPDAPKARAGTHLSLVVIWVPGLASLARDDNCG